MPATLPMLDRFDQRLEAQDRHSPTARHPFGISCLAVFGANRYESARLTGVATQGQPLGSLGYEAVDSLNRDELRLSVRE